MADKKRQPPDDALPAEPVSVWELLQDAVAATAARPENSVTPREFAQRTGYSRSHAQLVLRSNQRLRCVSYTANGRACKCYVPAEAAA